MKVMRVKQSFAYSRNGVPIVIPAGELIDVEKFDGYKGRENLFEPVESYVVRNDIPEEKLVSRVERATAAPEEKRIISGRIAVKKGS